MPYHVRNRVPIQDLRKGKRQAARQEDIVLQFFERHPNEGFTPFALQSAMGTNWPITSVRRALTDLTNEGKLEKHVEQQRIEVYGVRNCVWRLADREAQLSLL